MNHSARIIAALIVFVGLCSHDMFLKMDTYILDSGKPALIKIFNGSFDMSENVIDRERMIDVSMVGLGKRSMVDTALWSEKDSATLLAITTAEEGTWMTGVSIKPRSIEMKAADFNEYLEHDGLPDMLDWRKKNNALQQDAVEEYSKHAKVIFQVGDKLTDDYKTNLGYPLEFIPQQNPYDLHPGHSLQVQLLWQGKPLSNELVYVGYSDEHSGSHSHTHQHAHTHEDGHTHKHTDSAGHHHHQNTGGLRTNAMGMIEVPIDVEGVYYLKTIYLTASQKPGFTHESTRATLSFEIGSGHSHTHNHDHDHKEGLPTYVYLLASVALVGLLFWWFNRKRS